MLLYNDLIRENVLRGSDKGIYSHAIVYEDVKENVCKFHYVLKGSDLGLELTKILQEGRCHYKILEIYPYNAFLEKNLKLNEDYRNEASLSKKALDFAVRMHEGQVRSDNTPYIEHPKRVAYYVKKYKSNSKHLDILIPAALLHDTLEDTNLTFYDLAEFFNPLIASIVLELTTDEDLKKAIGKTKYLEIKLNHMTSWALLIKLCDRLDNVSDLITCDEEFRNRYALETIEILRYLLINRASRLSDTQIKVMREIKARLDVLNEILPSQTLDMLNDTHALLLKRK